jgi:hypothetical protein
MPLVRRGTTLGPRVAAIISQERQSPDWRVAQRQSGDWRSRDSAHAVRAEAAPQPFSSPVQECGYLQHLQ